jgi:hypothetical protein
LSETQHYYFQHPDTGAAMVLMRNITGEPLVCSELPEGETDENLTRAVRRCADIHEAWKLLKRERGVTE